MSAEGLISAIEEEWLFDDLYSLAEIDEVSMDSEPVELLAALHTRRCWSTGKPKLRLGRAARRRACPAQHKGAVSPVAPAKAQHGLHVYQRRKNAGVLCRLRRSAPLDQ